MTSMSARVMLALPEVIVLAGAFCAAIIGLSRNRNLRRMVPWISAAALVGAMVATPWALREDALDAAGLVLPWLGWYVKPLLCLIGLALVAVAWPIVDRGQDEEEAAGRRPFDALRTIRGEFHALMLCSLAGAMLLAEASDLIWLFLALELVSLPTYVLVALGRTQRVAQEAAVKYFFLGALATAVFLYGFALLYGATGTLELRGIQEVLAAQAGTPEGLAPLATLGVLLAILGLSYKIAAVPMHFYAPDVYEGAAVPVTAFLGFVPKVAGFTAIVLVLSLVGWQGHSVVADGASAPYPGLPQPIAAVLWMMAVLTMTLGNIGALLQRSMKRTLAYSSVAHTGYMLVGVIAGAEAGLDALFFYLGVYGLMNTGALAAIAAIERRGEEVDHFDDLAGLRSRHPWVAASLAVCAASLVGMPPLLGFFGKLYLFMAAFEAGQVALVVFAVVNSAISAWYYLKFVLVPLVAPPSPRTAELSPVPGRGPVVVAMLFALLCLVLSPSKLLAQASRAIREAGATRTAQPETAVGLLDSRVPHP